MAKALSATERLKDADILSLTPEDMVVAKALSATERLKDNGGDPDGNVWLRGKGIERD